MSVKVALPSGKTATLEIKSVLIPIDELKPETVDAIRNACEISALQKGVELWGPEQDMTVRDLNALDMSYTYNIFTETSNAGGNAWNAMATASAFTVATGTVIGIYGIKLAAVLAAGLDELPITGIRLDVGGARVVQWHIQSLETSCAGASVGATRPYTGISKSPIIIAEDIQSTAYEYTRATSVVYSPIWLGLAVEKTGRTLKP